MAFLPILSPSEQVAAYLRRGIRGGVWRGEMPGAPRLARELGVDAKTVLAALALLEREGMLAGQGAGRARRIVEAAAGYGGRPLRIAILLTDPGEKRLDYLGEMRHGLVEAGHHAYFTTRTLLELGMDLRRVRAMVAAEKADAWVVVSASREVLEWFAAQPLPAFAMFGRYERVAIAATMPEKIPAYEALIDRLVGLGHRRIVMIARKVRRLPEPGRTERAFLRRLTHHGIPVSDYNLPDWEDNKAGFQELLLRLFQSTPPTALIVQEAFVYSAIRHFLGLRGLRVPDDVSLACSDDDISFEWCEPGVSRIRWDSVDSVRRVIRWAAKTARGHTDVRQSFTKAEWLEGGTIAPVNPKA